MNRAMFGRRAARRRRVAAALAGTASSVVLATAASALAAGGETVVTVIHVPAQVVENRCNGDVVNLHGDLRIRTTTTPTRDGGSTVRAITSGQLTGDRISPGPPMSYRALDIETSFGIYPPAPRPSSFTDVHVTTLVPLGRAPTMHLLEVTRETLAPDAEPATSTTWRCSGR